jgi:hypothetical protein
MLALAASGRRCQFAVGEHMSLTLRVAGVMVAGLLIAACGGTGGPSASQPASPRTSASATPPASTPAATSAPSLVPTGAATPFTYQPLFPFGSLADAQAWQASYASGGHQPWHLSADQTAVAFSQGYLGFSEINKVAGHSISGGDAHVTVGLTLPNGHISSAAVVHLVKFGTGRYAPWEVPTTPPSPWTPLPTAPRSPRR